MDGIHDLGGKQGFGRVRHSPVAQAFHEPWERRINALNSLAVSALQAAKSTETAATVARRRTWAIRGRAVSLTIEVRPSPPAPSGQP